MRKIFKISVVFILVLSMITGMGLSAYTTDSDDFNPVVGGSEIAQDEPADKSEEMPAEPGDQTDPQEGSEVGEPTNPEEPVEPKNPESPENPENPKNPEDPVDPEKPVDTENPEEPVKPQNPETPPVNPETPTMPTVSTTKLIINHIERTREDGGVGERIIETEVIEDLEIGALISSLSYIREYEGLNFIESDSIEVLIVEGENVINLYYMSMLTLPKAKLVINYIERTKEEEVTETTVERIIETEVMEGLEVGTIVSSLEFVKDYKSLVFIESDLKEILLLEGENTINLYYGYLDLEEYIPEAPDFPVEEGEEVEAPYIEEFYDGELGPFEEEEEFSRMSLFNLMTLESYSDEVNNKTWPNPGSLLLNKSGTEVPGTGNQWEITLEIQGKNKVETSDIVLVIDRSGSMSGSKMTNAKNAAENFVNTLLSDSSKTNIRIAIVSFAGDIQTNSVFQGYSGRTSLISAIEGLNANGGTHIQAGIKQAKNLLNGSAATYKNIVLLGDGAATYSYDITNRNNYLEVWTGNDKRTTSSVPESQFIYGTTVGDGNRDHYSFGGYFLGIPLSSNYYRNGASAVAEAGFAKAKGYEIYTIALDAGIEGNWTLQNVASPGNYYTTPSPTNLNIIFQEIAGRLSNAATNAVVTDPLGDMYDILGINASNYNSLITVSHGTLIYNTDNDTIIWNIGTINEGTTYWMKYKVALNYSAEGGVFYPSNKPTYISYTNIDGNNAKKYFPIPEFRLRALTFTKLLSDTGYENREFDIILEGPTGQYKKTWAISLKAGQSKSIKGLLPGTYLVREIVPMNFRLIGMSGGGISSISGNKYQLTIGNNDWNIAVSIDNERSNDGWFWDDPDPKINRFTVGGGSNHGSLPVSRDTLYAKLDYFIIPSIIEIDNRTEDV